MRQRKTEQRDALPTAQTERFLEDNYAQLLSWAMLLTRGDGDRAHEVVQEFCAYVMVAKPDFGGIANLNGYLYTCLRHIYVSGLTQATREALRSISIAEFDTFAFVAQGVPPGDLLQQQNDLRRIASYAVWRKECSKSSSYFLLHFFHGYFHREIAAIARVPLSAIYNKLRSARTEIKSYLGEEGKVHVIRGALPPEPALSWSLVSTAELFREIRSNILEARSSACLPEEQLLAHYSSSVPIPCSLLSHLVSCDSCLAIVDRHFRWPTLRDREPLDGLGPSPGDTSRSAAGGKAMNLQTSMNAARQRAARIYEHRPDSLSIVVNGRVVASHDLQGERSTLSSRIEHPERAQFVEVFTEQQVRLALLPIEERPPEGAHVQTQFVRLSDDRWLELHLSFDGLGLNSEVTYFDPALAAATVEKDQDEELPVLQTEESGEQTYASGVSIRAGSRLAGIARYVRSMLRFPAAAWAVALASILYVAGFVAYRYTRPSIDANALLRQSVNVEAADLEGQTEHQVLHVEVASESGQVRQQGTVDLWRDGNGARYLRRLYDEHHRLQAAEWQAQDGQRGSFSEAGGDIDSVLRSGDLWKQSVSAHSFSELSGSGVKVRTIADGYELTVANPTRDHPQLVSAILVLDRGLHPVRECLRVRSGAEIEELRFVQADYQWRPSASVPDATFLPDDATVSPGDRGFQSLLSRPDESFEQGARNAQLARLEIAVLYQLNQLGADTGDPIEVARTRDGRIRLTGTIADETRADQIRAHLNGLVDHQLLDLRLNWSRSIGARHPGTFRELSGATKVFDVGAAKAPADAILRGHFSAKGLSGARLDDAVARHSSEVLATAQHALQSAYALDRLGATFSPAEFSAIGPSAQQQWTEMVEKHTEELKAQLRLLNNQLAELASPGASQIHTDVGLAQISDPLEFARVANRLLHQVQDVNHIVGKAFSAPSSEAEVQPAEPLLDAAAKAIPMRETEELGDFAGKMAVSARASVKH